MSEAAPTARRAILGRQRRGLDVRPFGEVVRRRAFWTGYGGLFVTFCVTGLVIALLIGWVLIWANDGDGANVLWIVLGSVGFSPILILPGMLLNRLRANERLRRAEATFLTGASHNLRTPLAAIKTAAQTLNGTELEPGMKRRLEFAILHEVQRLELRIDNILETTRLDLERRRFNGEPIELGEFVEARLDDARWAFAARGGQATFAAGPRVHVMADSRALALLFDNLIDNALKYSDGPPVVHASVALRGGRAIARVADEGIGFEQDQAELLFVRFRRGDTGRPGNGLGLALARAIARSHGGDLTLMSDGNGKGTTAEVAMPISRPTSSAEDTAGSSR